MTTTPTRPTFIKNAHGHYACPAPGCQRAFIAPAGAGRHWTANHEVKQPSTNGHQPDEEVDPFDLGHLRALADEVAQEKNAEAEQDEERDDFDGSTLYVNEEGPVTDTLESLFPETSPATDNGLQLLTPDQVRDRTTCRLDVDAVLALSDATTGLVDAITRLVGVGYARDEARAIVLDLIAKLDGRPA